METSYQDYINIINEVEKIEEVVIKDSTIRKCCSSSLEVLNQNVKKSKQYE